MGVNNTVWFCVYNSGIVVVLLVCFRQKILDDRVCVCVCLNCVAGDWSLAADSAC